jgi:hypothetical protein
MKQVVLNACGVEKYLDLLETDFVKFLMEIIL